jgi:hypothetical protein
LVGAERLPVTDRREPQARERRLVPGATDSYLYLADSAVQPPLPDLISSRLALAAPTANGVELHRADVGFWFVAARSASSPGPFALPGASLGAAVVGNLVGEALFQKMRGDAARTFAVAQYEISVGGQRITGSQYVELRDGLDGEQALGQAMTQALAALGERASAVAIAPRGPGK